MNANQLKIGSQNSVNIYPLQRLYGATIRFNLFLQFLHHKIVVENPLMLALNRRRCKVSSLRSTIKDV